MPRKNTAKTFELMDCALITLATGKRAINLRELRDRIQDVPSSSLYYHFYENLLRPSFDDPEFRNDFAVWAKRALHDSQLAEKLGMVDPLTCCDLNDLRQELLDVIEDHLAEKEFVPWARPDQEFQFLTSKVVVFDTGQRFATVEELSEFIPRMSTGSIYFHFIEARRRQPENVDDFSAWLSSFGKKTKALQNSLAQVDYYFWTLPELRDRLSRTLKDRLGEVK